MKFFLVALILSGLSYGGYYFYQKSSAVRDYSSSSNSSLSKLDISHTGDRVDDLAKVLGDSISNTLDNGKEILSSVTRGASEPVINQLVTKTTETLKDLPRQQAEKIKYEFCRGIVQEYEDKSIKN